MSGPPGLGRPTPLRVGGPWVHHQRTTGAQPHFFGSLYLNLANDSTLNKQSVGYSFRPRADSVLLIEGVIST